MITSDEALLPDTAEEGTVGAPRSAGVSSPACAGGPVNPYEQVARLRKAYGLARILFRFDLTPEQVATMTHTEWCSVASVARVKPPSNETKAVAIETLRRLYVPIEDGIATEDDF
jgi:hypothetical protein